MRLGLERPSGHKVSIIAFDQTDGTAAMYDFYILLRAISEINAGVERCKIVA